MRVHVVTYEWKNWSRDIFAFGTAEAAEAHVIDQAKEIEAARQEGSDDAIVDLQTALDALTGAGHSCEVDELDVSGEASRGAVLPARQEGGWCPRLRS